MKKKQQLEKLIEQYEQAEDSFGDAEYMIDKQRSEYEGHRKISHDKMIELGHQIMKLEQEIAEQDPSFKKDYFAERKAEISKASMTKEQIVNSDLSWHEKKKLFAEIKAEEDLDNEPNVEIGR